MTIPTDQRLCGKHKVSITRQVWQSLGMLQLLGPCAFRQLRKNVQLKGTSKCTHTCEGRPGPEQCAFTVTVNVEVERAVAHRSYISLVVSVQIGMPGQRVPRSPLGIPATDLGSQAQRVAQASLNHAKKALLERLSSECRFVQTPLKHPRRHAGASLTTNSPYTANTPLCLAKGKNSTSQHSLELL